MRKLLALAATLAVMVALTAALFTDREILSFSEPDIDTHTASNSVPPNQSQPQDFAGAGSQYYYFGPDFICQVFTNTTVRCYGSDSDGVVSNVPTQTGFTNVDGGETYACAFHEATRFNYCWGSITLRPTTVQPTATPEPTSTPEATATALPPGVTPEPTATSEPTATATPEPEDPCMIAIPATATLPLTLTGSWIEDCVYPIELDGVADGDRYYRYVSLNVISAPQSWTATLTSDEDTYMLLWQVDAATETWTLLGENDDIAPGNTNSQITWTPTEGQDYVIDLTTYTATTVGDFTLTIADNATSGQGQSATPRLERSDAPANTPLDRRQ